MISREGKSVLSRHWNHRDAERTKVKPQGTWMVFLLETTDAENFGELVRAAAAGLADGLL